MACVSLAVLESSFNCFHERIKRHRLWQGLVARRPMPGVNMPAASVVRAEYPLAITDHGVSERVGLLVAENVNEVTRYDIETQVDRGRRQSAEQGNTANRRSGSDCVDLALNSTRVTAGFPRSVVAAVRR